MLIAQITDTHIKSPGRLAYGRVDTATMFKRCVAGLLRLKQQPDVILITGDLVDLGQPDEYDHLLSLLAPLRQRIFAVPGNHDDRAAMRAALGRSVPADAGDFLQFSVDDHALRIIGLDTLIPGQGGGELCAKRLHFLDAALRNRPEAPTLIMMHHPPFDTGIGHMDRIGLKGREEFAAIVARHAQVQLIACGHVHRTIHAIVGGKPAMICPGTAHIVALDIAGDAPSCFMMEPPGFMLHWWNGSGLVTHVVPIGDYDGPYPFFGPDGKLID
jgi:3',5'-cyclic AMP phosphodiesterase CpdA